MRTGPFADKVFLCLFSDLDHEQCCSARDALSLSPELLLFTCWLRLLLSSETVLHKNCWCQGTQWFMVTVPHLCHLVVQYCFPYYGMVGTSPDCPAQPALTCCTNSVRVWSVERNGGGWETASVLLVSLFSSLTAAALLFSCKLLITHNHKLSINQWRRMVGMQKVCERKSVIYGRFWKLEKLFVFLWVFFGLFFKGGVIFLLSFE